MADPAQLERLLSGADLWNTWRLANPGTHPDLTGADLRGLRLSRWRPAWEGVINVYEPGFDLTWADLTDAAFTSAKCYTADFSYATLTRTDFADTELLHCDFRNADLTRARLDRSWLTNARFSKTILYETSFRGTRLWNTTFADVDLSEVVGLADAEHYGPSTLGMDTLMRSGELPPSFMLGCGIPTSINEYLPSLLLGEKAWRYYSCFISHSAADRAFVEHLHSNLRHDGIPCWLAADNMKIGDKVRVTIDNTIRAHEKLLLVVSESSIRSQWVEQEVETALDQERQSHRTLLFPIRIDDAMLDADSGWPLFVKNTRYVGDFTGWRDPERYRQAYRRLSSDLRSRYNS